MAHQLLDMGRNTGDERHMEMINPLDIQVIIAAVTLFLFLLDVLTYEIAVVILLFILIVIGRKNAR